MGEGGPHLKNEHATAVIDTYLEGERHPVPHAILIEGPWGSGKTYFLEKIYVPERQAKAKANRFNKTPFLFVSLFGVTTAAEVERRIHRAASPGEVVVGTTLGVFLTGLMEICKIRDARKKLFNAIRKSAARRHMDYIFVFDDLERVEAGALGEVMGFVNSLISQGRRAILVGDEGKLREVHKEGNWDEQNEKIIGRRVRIEADVESVVRHSIEEISDGPTKIFMAERVDSLVHLASCSHVENLRNLSWAVVNGARFVRSLLTDEEIRESHADHIARTMLVVVATTLWYRSTKLSKGAMERLPNLSMMLAAESIDRSNQTEEEDPDTVAAKDFMETFTELGVDSPPLEYRRIIDFEATGVLDDHEFTSWTKSQFGFGKGRSEPSWRRLWFSYERSMAQTDEAIEQLTDELFERLYTNRGHILHAAGLAIKHDKVGDTRLTNGSEVVSFFKRYIDDLVDKGSLEVNDMAPFPFQYDSAEGLGYTSKNSPEFKEIYQYLSDKQTEVEKIALEKRAQEIINEAEAGNLDALFKLNVMNDDLSRRPVLLGVDVERMASLIAGDVPALNVGLRLLAYRYNQGRSGDPLMTEIPWARKVYEAVIAKVNRWPEPHRTLSIEIIEGLIRHYERDRHERDRILPAPPDAESDTKQTDHEH